MTSGTKIHKGISYFGTRLPDHVYRDLDIIKNAGCTYIVHTLSEEDIQFNMRNMQEIIERTKELDIDVHLDPWGVAGIFGGETYSRYIAKKPENRQVSSDGKPHALACINHPDLWEYMYEWINRAAKLGASTIFWDEPHFFVSGWLDDESPEDVWGCRCSICQQAYYERFKKTMPYLQTADVKIFKKECLIKFLTAMFNYSAKKGLANTLCLLPNEDMRDSGMWNEFASIQNLNGFGTDPYWIKKKQSDKQFDLAEYLKPFCRKIKNIADTYSIRGHIWIQNFSIPKGWEHDIATAIDIIVSEGITDISAWSFYGTKAMGALRSDRPHEVWNTLQQKYLEI